MLISAIVLTQGMTDPCPAAIVLPLPQLSAWPFAAASVFLGAYALIPYMCLWSPPRNPEKLPLPASELVRVNNLQP